MLASAPVTTSSPKRLRSVSILSCKIRNTNLRAPDCARKDESMFCRSDTIASRYYKYFMKAKLAARFRRFLGVSYGGQRAGAALEG
mmetsp:Transcript_6557/g.20730  ORF Transcript_6557/g.20730 Transcript_6557/m.20730 type:complete len:86 (+) Transcript_6557:2474-2731(+)